MGEIRRIITGHDAAGASIFQEVSAVEPVVGRAMRLWGVWGWDGETPRIGAGGQPRTFDFDRLLPAPGGVRIAFVEHPALGDAAADTYTQNPTPGDVRIMELANSGGRVHDRVGRFHSTDTIDIVFIVSGEIDFEQDGEAVVRLREGDCMVVYGTRHQWVNRSGKPCRMGSVIVGADRHQS